MALRKAYSRGIATAEAVIVLPIFIVMLISLFYVQDLVTSRQHAEAKTRACVWLYSNNNCTQVPEGCQETLLRLRDAAEHADEQVEKALGAANFWPVSLIVSSILKPVLHQAFGRAVSANTHVPYQRPSLYGGGFAVATGDYHLACNITRRDETQVIKEAWDAILDGLR